MSYEDSLACHELATKCCCCSRPLVDAMSVESGIGPVCASKYGFDINVSKETRERANELVHKLAIAVSKDAAEQVLIEDLEDLRELGFSKIADIFEKRQLRIDQEIRVVIEIGQHQGKDCIFARVPFNPSFNQDSYTPGRYGTKLLVDGKQTWHWLFPATSKARKVLWNALCANFPRVRAEGPSGLFTIPSSN